MQMNWKVRFKNKVWLGSFVATIVTFAYTIMGMFDVAPEITQNALMNVINGILMMLSLTGVIVDPTTAGIGDSDRAMTYNEPYVDYNDENNGATELEG